MKLYVAHSVMCSHKPHILGIFTDENKAKQAVKIGEKTPDTRVIIQEYESEVVYVTEEDKTLFDIAGFTVNVDEGSMLRDILTSVSDMADGTMLSEDEEGNIIETRIVTKAADRRHK